MMENWPVARIETEKRRLLILQHLRITQNYQASLDILQMACKAQGCSASTDSMRQAIAWLEDSELVVTHMYGQLVIVTATQKGLEVAVGDVTVPGIQRPGPAL